MNIIMDVGNGCPRQFNTNVLWLLLLLSPVVDVSVVYTRIHLDFTESARLVVLHLIREKFGFVILLSICWCSIVHTCVRLQLLGVGLCVRFGTVTLYRWRSSWCFWFSSFFSLPSASSSSSSLLVVVIHNNS